MASVQIILNAFRLKPLEQVLPAAQQAGVGIIARVPLASGLLSGRYGATTTFPADDHRSYNRDGSAFDVGETFSGVPWETGLAAAQEFSNLVATAGPEQLTPAQAALAWCWQQPGVTTVIPGARNREQAAGQRACRPRQASGRGLRGGCAPDLRHLRARGRPHALVTGDRPARPSLSCMLRLAATAATLALLLATGTAAPVEARTPQGTYAQQAFAATNAKRAQHGLPALRKSKCLRRAAVRQATLMAQREQMFHQDLGAVLKDCHLTAAGENLAAGYPSGTSAVTNGWMTSDGHRANILNRSFRIMGIGARKGHNGKWYVAQVFGRRG